MTLLLTERQLTRFEELLREHDVPVDGCAQRGLSDDEIDSTMDAVGLRLPREARVWWHWHDGVVCDDIRRLPGPWHRSLSLGAAIEQYEKLRRIAQNTAADWPQNNPDVIWHPTWLPIINGGQPIAIECAVSEDAPAPVLHVDWTDLDKSHQPRFDKPRAASIGEMVGWWITALETGAWYWDEKDGWWRVRVERLDPALRTNPLL